MSYDINVYKRGEVSDDGYTYASEELWTNITYNVREMLCLAFDNEEGIYCLDGLAASEALVCVDQAISRMKISKDAYAKLSAPNGWGTFESTLKALSKIHDNLVESLPNGWVEVT